MPKCYQRLASIIFHKRLKLSLLKPDIDTVFRALGIIAKDEDNPVWTVGDSGW